MRTVVYLRLFARGPHRNEQQIDGAVYRVRGGQIVPRFGSQENLQYAQPVRLDGNDQFAGRFGHGLFLSVSPSASNQRYFCKNNQFNAQCNAIRERPTFSSAEWVSMRRRELWHHWIRMAMEICSRWMRISKWMDGRELIQYGRRLDPHIVNDHRSVMD